MKNLVYILIKKYKCVSVIVHYKNLTLNEDLIFIYYKKYNIKHL